MNPVSFYTPLVCSSRERGTWWGWITQLANDYLSPLNRWSGTYGLAAQAGSLTGRVTQCVFAHDDQRSWVAEAAKVVSYVLVPLPILASLIKLGDRSEHTYVWVRDQLVAALETRDSRVIWGLYKAAAVSAHDLQSESGHAIELFASLGQTDRVAELLKNGIDGDRAAHEAVRGNHVATLRLLLQNGVDPDWRNIRKETLLHVAAAHGAYACVEELLKNRATVSAVTPAGKTARDLLMNDAPAPICALLEAKV